MVERYKSVVVLEDGIRHGGIASSISELFRDAGVNVPLHSIGVPLDFLEHSKRSEILNDIGVTAQNIARSVVEWSSSFKEEMQPQLDENVNRTPNR